MEAPAAATPPSVEKAPTEGAVAGAPWVVEVNATVPDLPAALDFFQQALGAQLVERRKFDGPELDALYDVHQTSLSVARLRIGDEHIVLQSFAPPGAAVDARRRSSNDSDFQHLAIVVSDIERTAKRVLGAGGSAISIGGPQTIPLSNPAAGGIRAFYFHTPAKRPLELIWYPSGKGNPRWNENPSTDGLLGIDHTAIAVSSTEASLSFYQKLVGLAVLGTSFNEGPEQSALSGVDSARVRITGLGGTQGMGVEFLRYESPGGSIVVPSRPQDAGYWEISIKVDALERLVAGARSFGSTVVSRRISQCPPCRIGKRALVLRDPDGHAVRLEGD